MILIAANYLLEIQEDNNANARKQSIFKNIEMIIMGFEVPPSCVG